MLHNMVPAPGQRGARPNRLSPCPSKVPDHLLRSVENYVSLVKMAVVRGRSIVLRIEEPQPRLIVERFKANVRRDQIAIRTISQEGYDSVGMLRPNGFQDGQSQDRVPKRAGTNYKDGFT